jgi:hypothetical protein
MRGAINYFEVMLMSGLDYVRDFATFNKSLTDALKVRDTLPLTSWISQLTVRTE